jgi:diguanylate cyclase (GGDEF)-like protein
VKESFKRFDSRLIIEIIAIAIIYVATAKVGQTFSIPPGNITPIWIPSGIMLALVVLRGYGIWPGIFFGAVIGNVWAYFDSESLSSVMLSLFASFSNGFGDVISALIAVFMLKRKCGTTNPFAGIPNFVTFLLYGAVIGPFISAFMGVGSLAIGGFLPWDDCIEALITWWVGDGVGALLIAPAILIFTFKGKVIDVRKVATELVLYLTAVALVAYLIIKPEAYEFILVEPIYMIIPLLFWSLFRLGHPVTYISLLFFFGLSINAAFNGVGAFTHPNQLIAMLKMQGYFVLVSSSVFIVGAILQDREQLLEKLEDKVSHDTLTGAMSRAYFDDCFEQESSRFDRYEISFSMVMIDLDLFKKINDQYGHLIGDDVLKQVVNIIQSSLRDSDTLARWGGEEFIVLLPATTGSGALQFAELARKRVENEVFKDEIKLTISLGVAEFKKGDSLKDFLQKLDSALYKSKGNGRNCSTLIE